MLHVMIVGCSRLALANTIIGPIIGAFIAGTVGFAAAIFVEPAKKLFFGPKLKLSFGNTPEFQTTTFLTGTNARTKYIRIKVTNTKTALAKVCRAYLIKVEKQQDDGSFHDTIYCDSIPLAWSCRDNYRFVPLDIPRGVNQFVDLVSTEERKEEFTPHIEVPPNRYIDLWKEKGIFRFTVQVSGENVKPEFITVEFAWSGKWDNCSCKQVQQNNPNK